MKTKSRILGALLAAVVGGCAGTKSTVVPIQPLAQGQPVDASSYDLTVDGQPGGRVLFSKGQSMRNADGQNVIVVGMEVDNRTGDRTYRMPADQMYLANLGGQPVKLMQVDGQPVPGAIDVAPGQTRHLDLTFIPVAPYAKRDLDNVQVHWTLLIDGANEPVVRTTSFARLNRDLTAERAGWSAQSNSGYPRFDIPASNFQRNIDMSQDFRAQQGPTNTWQNQGQANRGGARHQAMEGPER